jgi:hypothetical protein
MPRYPQRTTCERLKPHLPDHDLRGFWILESTHPVLIRCPGFVKKNAFTWLLSFGVQILDKNGDREWGMGPGLALRQMTGFGSRNLIEHSAGSSQSKRALALVAGDA